MLKKLAFAAFALFFAFALTACGGSAQATAQDDLDGTWNYSSETLSFVADVRANTITVTVQMATSEGLYWVGTFADASDDTVIVSKGDEQALKASLFGSSSASKEFHYKDGKLTFDFTMMGVTKPISLEK